MKRPVVHLCMLTLMVFAIGSVSNAQPGAVEKVGQRTDAKKKKNKNGSVNGQLALTVYSATSQAKTVNLGASKSDFIIIDWAEPAGENITLVDGYLQIKLKMFSSSVINKDDIVVYHNQSRKASKMDVSGLFGEQKEFTYTDRLLLAEGSNEILVEVASGKLIKRSKALVIHKNGKTISARPFGVSQVTNHSSTSVYWWTAYDPVTLNGKPYSSKEKILPVKFKILTQDTVSLKNLRLHHNELGLAPGPKALLERDIHGNFTFTDEVSLLDAGGLNEIYLEVVADGTAVKSEKLIVDYSPFRPNLHILSIGTETNLQYTLKDARDFARLFTGQGGAGGNRIFNKILIDTLFGAKATAQEIKGRIEELKVRYFTGSISPDDVILTFVSSHGFLLDGDFRVQGDDYSPARQRSTSVSFRNDVVNILESIPCKKIIMIDACHSGGARANPSDINFEINKLNSVAKGLTVLASSRGEEQSYEDATWQNGAFTASIIKGLRQAKADADRTGIISMHELSEYVSREVAAMVKNVKNRPQNPLLVNDELGDVAIYLVDR